MAVMKSEALLPIWVREEAHWGSMRLVVVEVLIKLRKERREGKRRTNCIVEYETIASIEYEETGYTIHSL